MANHFDLTDLQLIVNIGEASSLTRGAEKTHLSLPAASNRVKNLEEHFGTRLFHRNSQGVSLTPSGEAFLRHARLVLRQIDSLRGEIHEYARGIKGQVRMVANTTAMTEFMPAVLSRYLATHPDVTVELRERLQIPHTNMELAQCPIIRERNQLDVHALSVALRRQLGNHPDPDTLLDHPANSLKAAHLHPKSERMAQSVSRLYQKGMNGTPLRKRYVS